MLILLFISDYFGISEMSFGTILLISFLFAFFSFIFTDKNKIKKEE